ncbi:glutathione ABC transporter substrate-binding protein [Virgibacillus sp. YIM 98842]|uniref:glutathione ABC transporter substrate-binding protein n=1 Tax=Virgibacillus sp. YIM 98842 TaxID=2663533 RepID=UPI0013DB15CA|nr:glutathione ABC transporter substrate-binding protein [Virgibacillus sp. YIM 98842]
MNLTKKVIAYFIMVMFLGLVLTACASEPDDDSGSDASGGEETEESQGGDLVIAKASDAVSLDPNGSNDIPSYDVQINIFETLIKQNQDMELTPSLATDWEAVEDNVWEFTLQEGVTFHDGAEFNADVVKKNVERILDPEVASSQASLFEMITDIEVVDDYTIRFTTEYPFASLPAHLAHPVSGMVSPDLIDEDYQAMENGDEPGTVINENPIGTGYFKFDEWVPGEYVRLTRNDDYWEEPAKLDSVTFKVTSEDLTRVAELQTGDSHITNPLSPSDVEQIETHEETNVQQQESVSLAYIGFNTSKEPFDDKRVRQAISMAVDKNEIIEGIYDGYAVPAVGPIPPGVLGYDENASGMEHNIEKAKELLAEAGYEDGFETTIMTNDARERIDTATNVQAQLAEIGIDINIEVLEWGAYLEATANGDHEMYVLGWVTGTGDTDYATYPLYHSQNVGAPGNRTFTQNDEVDSLLEEGRQTFEEEERHEVYRELQETLVDLSPNIFLHYTEYLLGVRNEVKGLEQLPTQYLMLKDVYLEN